METSYQFATDRAGEVANQIGQAKGLGHIANPEDVPMITVRYIFGAYNALDVRKAILQSSTDNRRK